MSRNKKKRKAGKSDSTNERLIRIEHSLHGVQDQVSQTKTSMYRLEEILSELREIKQQLNERNSRRGNRRRISLFGGGRNGESENKTQSSILPFGKKQSENKPKSSDLPSIGELLKNPAVQSLLKKNGGGNSGSKNGAGGLSDMLGGIDMAQITKLLQNPMVQSMMKNMF
ncbi:hypothetical protein [Aneurinibacillus tyrosinisolvens]|uniref:hypothetical protein n=1 Tax=Aneurinibacillus tyrosinisolvens TaxID=1443435 RepID=UPI00063FA8E7|nr:hypothetical protein [Aneurinibacillus tyrosinisolvens]